MKALINSMLMYWLLLLSFALGAAAAVYLIWLKEAMA